MLFVNSVNLCACGRPGPHKEVLLELDLEFRFPGSSVSVYSSDTDAKMCA